MSFSLYGIFRTHIAFNEHTLKHEREGTQEIDTPLPNKARCGHPVRAGLNIWKPYEYLPLEMQMNMLEAAATAMEMLEEGVLGISNKQSKLFQPEVIQENEYSSGFEPLKRNNEHHGLTFGETLTELFEKAVAEARVNRESAQRLQALYLFGRKDPEVTREVEIIFLKLGIPFKDL